MRQRSREREKLVVQRARAREDGEFCCLIILDSDAFRECVLPRRRRLELRRAFSRSYTTPMPT